MHKMVENVYFRVVFIVLMAAPVLRANIFDDVGGAFADGVCTILSTKDIESCGVDFANEVADVDNKAFEELKTRRLCCAFNHLRDCINDAIGDKCGDSRDSIVQKTVTAIVGAAKTLTNEDCRTYTGTTGDVLCLNDYLLIAIGIGAILLFLFVCSATIRMCCSRRHYGSGSGQFMLLPQTNADKHRY